MADQNTPASENERAGSDEPTRTGPPDVETEGSKLFWSEVDGLLTNEFTQDDLFEARRLASAAGDDPTVEPDPDRLAEAGELHRGAHDLEPGAEPELFDLGAHSDGRVAGNGESWYEGPEEYPVFAAETAQIDPFKRSGDELEETEPDPTREPPFEGGPDPTGPVPFHGPSAAQVTREGIAPPSHAGRRTGFPAMVAGAGTVLALAVLAVVAYAALRPSTSSTSGSESAASAVDRTDAQQPDESNPQSTEGAAPVGAEPELRITLTRAELLVAGTVPDPSVAEALVAGAMEASPLRIRSELAVDENLASVDWLERAPEAIAAMGVLTEGVMTISRGEIAVSGSAPPGVDLEEFGRSLAESTGLAVASTVTTVELRPPAFGAAASAGTLTLSGVVPAEEIRTAVVNTAGGIYGPDNVIDELSVDPGVESIAWMDGEGAWLQALSAFGEYELRTENRSLSGYVTGAFGPDPGSTTLDPAFLPVLDLVAAEVTASGAPQLLILAHTDIGGGYGPNHDLSHAQGDAVVEYLIGAGVPPDALRVVGMGNEEPLSDDRSEQGVARNRRVGFTTEAR